MTLNQLKYVCKVAECGALSKAASELYLSQPSLTKAIHELENEVGIIIFERTNKGINISKDGEVFLGYARQVLDQLNLIDERYTGTTLSKQRFCVSSQHYSFAVEGFVELLKKYGGEKYEFHMRETQTYDIIDDVTHLRSEIGILYINDFNKTIIEKTLRDNNLSFTSLFKTTPHVFVGKDSPLAKKKTLTLDDLKPYPRLSYEQGSHNSFYFSEEILSTVDCDKELIVKDRATLFNLLIGMNGYTICSGVISEELNGPNIVARPLNVEDYMDIGYILPNPTRISNLTSEYISILEKLTK